MNNVKLNKRIIDAITPPTDKDQEFYRDAECKYLCLRVTKSGLKTFVFEGTISKGKHVRRTIGKYGALTVDQARAETINIMQRLQQGDNPFQQDVLPALQDKISLNKVYQDYVLIRTLGQRTAKDYDNVIKLYFGDWLEHDLNHISRTAVQKRYLDIKSHSPSQANKAMRVLRALYKFARFQYEHEGKPIVVHNPVEIISHTRLWAKIPRRQSIIPINQLKAFYDVLSAFKTADDYHCKGDNEREMIVDYILMLLFHGLRAGEAAMITRDNISFEDKTLTLPAENTKAKRKAVLPLSDFTLVLLRRRIAALKSGKSYLFHKSMCDKPLNGVRKPLMWIESHAGIKFCLHDLRRTFITVAEYLDISPYSIKMLVNHHLPSNDVTAGYVVMTPERIRAANQKIAEYLQTAMGLLNDSVVILKKAT